MAEFHQFVPAEGKTIKKTKPLGVKIKEGLLRKAKQLSNDAEHVRGQVKQLKEKALKEKALEKLLAFLIQKLKGCSSDYRDYSLPLVYRTAMLLSRHPKLTPNTCWKMALIVEHSERSKFDDVTEIGRLLESSQFAVYRASRYDQQPSFDISANGKIDIKKRVEPIFRIGQPVIQTLNDAPTKVIAEYTIGSGTYGTVTKMSSSDGPFARKVIGGKNTGDVLDGCVREISLMRELTGAEHIIQLKTWATSIQYVDRRIESCTYDMELGIGSLADNMEEFDDDAKRYDLFIQMAKGIKVCHDARIMHRDLKPDNIILFGPTSNRIAKLADFGLARRVSAYAGRTYTCNVVTKWWRAPEIWEGYVDRVDSLHYGCGVDVFSFGIIMCDVLYGRLYTPYTLQEHLDETQDKAPFYGEWPEKQELTFNNVKPNQGEEDGSDDDVMDDEKIVMAKKIREIITYNNQVDIYWRDFMSGIIQTKVAEMSWPQSVQSCLQPESKERPNISTVLKYLQGEQKRLVTTSPNPSQTQRRQALKTTFPRPPNIKLQRRAALEARF